MIALIDCNSFYASCETAFRPDLIGKPIVVLSNNDGCIISRNAEAKTLGIPMTGAAYKLAGVLKKHNVAVFSSNYPLYSDMSRRVMNIIARNVPAIEVYSIDEAFAILDEIPADQLESHSRCLAQTIRQCTGIPVSIGVGPTKVLAKAANTLAKKRKEELFLIPSAEAAREVLADFPVRYVWGIGHRHAAMLERYGITTAGKLSSLDEDWVRKKMTVMGLRLHKELNGTRCIGMEDVRLPKRAIATTRSFGEMVTSLDDLREAVSSFAAACAEKLRAQQSACFCVTTFILTNRFRGDLDQYSESLTVNAAVPTNTTFEVVAMALQALQRTYKPGFSYKKAGVIVTGIVPQDQIQSGLFHQDDSERLGSLSRLMDEVNAQYGRETLQLGTQTGPRRWKMLQEHLSPQYTTRPEQMLTIRV